MSDFRKTLSEMRRPSMLMRAARLGLPDYHRSRWLKRLAPGETSPEADVEIASRLLHDRALYAHAVQAGSQQAAAR